MRAQQLAGQKARIVLRSDRTALPRMMQSALAVAVGLLLAVAVNTVDSVLLASSLVAVEFMSPDLQVTPSRNGDSPSAKTGGALTVHDTSQVHESDSLYHEKMQVDAKTMAIDLFAQEEAWTQESLLQPKPKMGLHPKPQVIASSEQSWAGGAMAHQDDSALWSASFRPTHLGRKLKLPAQSHV